MFASRTAVAVPFLVFLLSNTLAQAQVVTGEAVSEDPATAEPPATVAVPPPPPVSGGAVYVPGGSAPAYPSSTGGVYAPSTGVYTPAAVPREQRVIDWGLVGGGIGLFAGGWLVTWISTSVWYSQTTSCTSTGWFGYSCTHVGGPGGEGLAWSFLPVVGPWLMLTDSYLDTPGEVIFPILAGLVQDAGLIMLIVGLATMSTETVMVEARRAGDWRVGGNASPNSVYGTFDLTF